MDAGSRPRVGSHTGLAPSNGEYKREETEVQTKTSLPAISTSMSRNHSGPTVSSLISPPDSSRNTQETPDTAHSHPPRQSLPSIREALMPKSDMSYTQQSQSTASYAPAPASSQAPNSPNSAKRIRPAEVSQRDAQHTPSTSSYITNANYSGTAAYAPYTRPPSSESRTAGWIASHQPPVSQNTHHYQSWSSYSTPTHDNTSRTSAPLNPAYSYGPPPPPYASSHANNSPTSAPGSAQYSAARPSSWRPSESDQDLKRADNARPTQYGESVKRHLDNYDLDNSLLDIGEAGNQLMRFSDYYKEKSFHAQRSGSISSSIPPMVEVDEMVKQTMRAQDSLTRLQAIVQTHEIEMAERNKENQAKEARIYRQEEANALNDDLKSTAAIGSDAKKRRGRAAPPGRCHSCNRAETPEWRRGPDGARTLCNACGLHYAKLTRKAANKGSHGGSSLRPKSMDPASPSM